MNKVALVVKNKIKLDGLKELVLSKGFKIVTKNPDFVMSVGGDGTFLISERKYPSVPKLILKDSKICKKCVGGTEDTILDLILQGKYKLEDEIKIKAEFNLTEIIGVNDIIIRNKKPNQAVRLDLHVGSEKIHEEVIGDGLVISTPFGSSAYYKSITGKHFSKGFGIAFNNPTEPHKPILLNEDEELRVKIVRGDLHITADNNSKIYTVKEGDWIKITALEHKAKIIKLKL